MKYAISGGGNAAPLGYGAYLTAPGAQGTGPRAEFAATAARFSQTARVEAWEDSRLLCVRMPADRPRGGGRRGNVAGCSRAARKRLLCKIHTVRRDAALPKFVTLTFPDFFPTPAQAKKVLDNLFKRWKRKWPKTSAIWRMEEIDRKSGANAGQVAPHFHLLVWGHFDAVTAARDWFEVNGESDYAHLSHGTDAQDLESWGGAVFYCAKYIAAVDESPRQSGRTWGTHNKAALPTGPVSRRVVPLHEAFRILRLTRKLSRSRSITLAISLEQKSAGEVVPGCAWEMKKRARSAWRKSRKAGGARTLFTAEPSKFFGSLGEKGTR